MTSAPVHHRRSKSGSVLQRKSRVRGKVGRDYDETQLVKMLGETRVLEIHAILSQSELPRIEVPVFGKHKKGYFFIRLEAVRNRQLRGYFVPLQAKLKGICDDIDGITPVATNIRGAVHPTMLLTTAGAADAKLSQVLRSIESVHATAP